MSFSGAHAIVKGDALATLRELPDNEFDALFCDPPYGLSFMGKKWDYDVPSVDVWRECLRVLKPGAPLLAFGGSRTFHRIAVGIEDAGFELRDVLSWMYATGFPKSLDVSKAIDKVAGHWRGRAGAIVSENPAMTGGNYERTPKGDPITAAAAAAWAGYGTALKPAWEPCILARKPLEGTVANNVAKWGVGGLAIDACRIGTGDDKTPAPTSRGDSEPWFTTAGQSLGGNDGVGRWPANVVLDEEAGAVLDAQTGVLHTHGGSVKKDMASIGYHGRGQGSEREIVSSKGGASRFFYSSKVSTKEREHGCLSLPMKSAAQMTDSEDGQARLESPRTGAGRGGGARNHHPTLKPISLAKWLASLIKPPTADATLLVPFSGAGSEMIGALEAGWPMVFGIEGEQEYIDIAHARIAAWAKGAP